MRPPPPDAGAPLWVSRPDTVTARMSTARSPVASTRTPRRTSARVLRTARSAASKEVEA
jgi:hypothetical protein